MKPPAKPPNWRKIIQDNSSSVLKLHEHKAVFELIIKYNKEYLHWDKLRYKKFPKGINLEHVWALMKLFRSEKSNQLKFDGFDLKYTLLPSTHGKLHKIDKESAGNIQIFDSKLSQKGKEKYIISSLMEEAIASSQLEGAATTRKVAKEMLKQNRKPKTHSEQMIVNGYQTIKMILDKKKEKLSNEFLLEI